MHFIGDFTTGLGLNLDSHPMPTNDKFENLNKNNKRSSANDSRTVAPRTQLLNCKFLHKNTLCALRNVRGSESAGIKCRARFDKLIIFD